MTTQPVNHIQRFAEFFEPALLAELEANSMLMEVNAGDTILNIGQTIRAVPLLVSGAVKVSRINEEGQELMLYYVKEGESCAMTFQASTTKGTIKFHEFIGNGWAILFSHPKDFTPVCTTELGYMARIEPEFTKRNCKIIGLSVDPVESHLKWEKDSEETQGAAVNYPMIGDTDLSIAKRYDMLAAEDSDSCEGRTAVTNQTVRSVFIIGPDKKIKLQLTYPMTTGRNFNEILRVLDSMQLTAAHKVATPANWTEGQEVIIVPAVSDAEAKEKYPQGWKTLKPYLRLVQQPGS